MNVNFAVLQNAHFEDLRFICSSILSLSVIISPIDLFHGSF